MLILVTFWLDLSLSGMSHYHLYIVNLIYACLLKTYFYEVIWYYFHNVTNIIDMFRFLTGKNTIVFISDTSFCVNYNPKTMI